MELLSVDLRYLPLCTHPATKVNLSKCDLGHLLYESHFEEHVLNQSGVTQTCR